MKMLMNDVTIAFNFSPQVCKLYRWQKVLFSGV